MSLLTLKEQIQVYAQKAQKQGLVAGTSGNFSLRAPDGNILITPSGLDYGEMDADDVVVITLDGTVIEGTRRPSSEWPMHAEIYKNMPHVQSVVHTHSPYATAFAVVNEPIPLVLVEMVYFLLGDVRVAPVAVQGTPQVGLGVVEALQGRGACLMQNHGVVSVGNTLPEAFLRAEYTETAAHICLMAKAIGTPVPISEAIVQEMRERMK